MGRPLSAAAFFWFGRTSTTPSTTTPSTHRTTAKVPPPPAIVATLSPQSSPHPTAFGRWCDAVGIHAPHLVLGPTADGIPGVLVRDCSSLRPGQCAITVPLEACLVVRGSGGSGGGSSGSSSGSNEERLKREVPAKIRLACRLLSERRRGSASYHAGYIDHLPGPYPEKGWERADTLDRWSEEELGLLRSPELVKRTRERMRSDREWFDRLRKDNGSSEDDEEFVYTFEEFVWALGIVRTRAFSGDFDRSIGGGGSASGSSTTGGRTEQEQEKKVEDYALLPIIDDLNHRESTVTARRNHGMSTSTAPMFQYPAVMDVLGRTRTAVCWVAHIAHRPGQEVAHSYLTGSDGLGESFLHEWGFTPGVHDLDAVSVDVEGVDVILRGDGTMHDEGCVRNQLRKVLGGSGRPAAEHDIWESIARACDAAEADLTCSSSTTGSTDSSSSRTAGAGTAAVVDADTCNVVDSSTTLVAPHRRLIAQTFVDGRCKLLRSGAQACRANTLRN